MRKKTNINTLSRRRIVGWLLSALMMFVGTSDPVKQLGAIPDTLHLIKGNTMSIHFAMPLGSEIIQPGAQVLSSRDERLGEGGSQVSLTAKDEGDAQMILSLLGFPIKTVSVRVAPNRMVVPGGQSIGVAINMEGVLVVGASDVGAINSPARNAGLRAGDLIQSVNGQAITDASHLSEMIASGNQSQLGILRAGRALTVDILPVQDGRDSAYRLGAWVRDSTAGVGTLSFYEPTTHAFGALGHAITDADTGSVLTVSEGGIYESDIVGVMRGKMGAPGELLGEFFDDARYLGDVSVNGPYGIYGHAEKDIQNALYPTGIPILARSEVYEGSAQILTTLDSGGIRAFDCEITKLFRQDSASQRGMTVRITDPELLNATGGIVQGMSGSPIIQDGKIAGAVTHVFINDPTQGYGMYIEWMLDMIESLPAA